MKCLQIILLISLFSTYNSEGECGEKSEKEAVHCLIENPVIGNISEKLQNTLFVDFNMKEHENFCHHWDSTMKGCLEDAIHGCTDLERAFHGTIEAYNYLCVEGKTKYEELTWCTTDARFKLESEKCVKRFKSAVDRLDPRYTNVTRYQIVKSPPAKVTDNWEESCSRTYEFIHCQESVVAYCGTAKQEYIAGLKRQKEKTIKDLADRAKEFQHHFMEHMFGEHQGTLNCTRLSTLALILIVFAAIIVFLVLICLIPFCCCRPKRTGIVRTPSHPYGVENMAFRSDAKDRKKFSV